MEATIQNKMRFDKYDAYTAKRTLRCGEKFICGSSIEGGTSGETNSQNSQMRRYKLMEEQNRVNEKKKHPETRNRKGRWKETQG